MSVSGSFTGTGVSAGQFVPDGQKITIVVTGTYLASTLVEFSDNGGLSWRFVQEVDLPNVVVKGAAGNYRLRCTSYTSGTLNYTMDLTPKVPSQAVAGSGTSKNIAYDGTSLANFPGAPDLETAVNAVVGQQILYSDAPGFNILCDSVTDNDKAILKLLNVAENLRIMGYNPTIMFRANGGGNVCYASGHYQTLVNVDWGDVEYDPIDPAGSPSGNDNAPDWRQGSLTVNGCTAFWKNYKYRSRRTSIYANPQNVGIEFVNKQNCVEDSIHFMENGRRQVRYMAYRGSCSYNKLTVASMRVARDGVEYCVGSNDVGSFCAENTLLCGNFEQTSSAHGIGSGAFMIVSKRYSTGYSNSSGNIAYHPSGQMDNAPTAYPLSGNAVAGRRYLGNKWGSEWACLITGAVSGTEPAVIPTPITKTALTFTPGSNIVLAPDTSNVAIGQQFKGQDPTDAFPEDCVVTAINANVSVTLSYPAAYGSYAFNAANDNTPSNVGVGVFVPVTVDGAATMVYCGEFFRWQLWSKGAGRNCAVLQSRLEGGVGASGGYTGLHAFPQTASSAGKMTVEGHTPSYAAVRRIPGKAWSAGEVLPVAAIRYPTPIGATPLAWETLSAFTSGGAQPTTFTPATAALTTPGITITGDNGGSWRTFLWPMSNVHDMEELCGGIQPQWQVLSVSERTVVSKALGDLALNAIGSATTWLLNNEMSRGTSGGQNGASDFTATDFELRGDGLGILSTTSKPGYWIDCSQFKYWEIEKLFGFYKAMRGEYVAYDRNQRRLVVSTLQYSDGSYRRLNVTGAAANTAAGSVIDQNDTVGPWVKIAAAAEVAKIWCAIAKGSTPLTLRDIAVKALGHKVDGTSGQLYDGVASLGNPYSKSRGDRCSDGVPTAGIFLDKKEIIIDRSPSTGTPYNRRVTTPGGLAPAYNAAATVIGKLGSNGGNIYIANGEFTPVTAPTGTNDNIKDDAATGVTAGVSTWTWLCAAAAFSNGALAP